jgi:hypothetical protein
MPQDHGGTSPFAQVLSTLQQLQRTNPGEYQHVTQQISTKLQSAAQKAASQGNTAAANRLNKLAADFSQASRTDALPNRFDLADAVGASAHRTSGASSLSGQATSAFLSSLSQSSALNPATIIMDTISGAGVSGSIY